MSELESYPDKSPSVSRMGKAAEYLVAAVCILVTGGELNVSTSIVVDEGADLVFHRRGGSAMLAVQVKPRMSTGVLVGQDLRVPITYATCWCWWSRPPARSRRLTRRLSRSITFSGSGHMGAAWPSARWGRWSL